MYVVGAQGYLGSRVMASALGAGVEATAVSRSGDTRHGISSISWSQLLKDLSAKPGRRTEVIWILDGAKHNELDRLSDLLGVAGEAIYITAVSSCTVYGDQQGRSCDETTPRSLMTDNAQLKAACEDALEASSVSYSALRLGALYGVDDRGVRQDRIEKWVTEAAREGSVTVPEPTHWRGWLHREQGARALLRAASRRIEGVFNVASSNYRFGDAAAFAATHFDAAVASDGKDDPMDYRIDSTKAERACLLDQLGGEALPDAVTSFAEQYKL
ncbi:NAD-dependent epimerase/dehydratase family protein [Paractinoplanes rishiriensis]|uniref:NAD-dependent epimerase/dehydratase domain-containing protein n=1 Tax=Paractinoplanes rishiriensis TaxID=1050105 RepID=A0A919JV37_9ACTN|nr:NAD-dependent epimerase/dehydratase family protein [Actinoplanes rishiriensis]GIE93882.1 hypothetical protein Ari01nite_13470 [Actinoplanes rishiriensis]